MRAATKRLNGPVVHNVSSVALAAAAILDECRAFVGSCDDGQYVAESRVIPGGTIGKHVRHVLDHFRAVVMHDGVIDYDHRRRDVPEERDRRVALTAIAALRGVVAGLDERALGAAVRVRVMLSEDGAEAELDSSLGRELAFASHHAVHHHAMLGAIGTEVGAPPRAGFGRAPSTAHHERTVR
jgi:hypothetical protein